MKPEVLFILSILLTDGTKPSLSGTTEEDTFNGGYDSWTLPDKSWTRVTMGSIIDKYSLEFNTTDDSHQTIPLMERENMVLVPYPALGEGQVLSTMSRDLDIPGKGELELLFSVLLVGWKKDNLDENDSNSKLQVFYDEDMVFDIGKAVHQHEEQFSWNSWNQFKMVSRYREAVNMTITVVGSRGLGNSTFVVIDSFIITITTEEDNFNGELGTIPRLEPEADIKENGSWKKIETEALKEAEDEMKEKGRPSFCVLLPETGPCTFNKKRYFFNSTTGQCEEFYYGGCQGNENRFEDIESCSLICADRETIEPLKASLRTTTFTTFETGFEGWDVRNWVIVKYDERDAKWKSINKPPDLDKLGDSNEIGIHPDRGARDFRLPELTQEFIVEKHATLIIEFQLLIRGLSSTGFLSVFLQLDPGFEIYVGNVKVFDFVQHGTNDEHWHKYRLTMNEHEVEEHRIATGDSFLLITLKGWLGNAKDGEVVLDNINVTQIVNGSHSEEVNPNLNSEDDNQLNLNATSPHTFCMHDRDPGNCKGAFSRYGYEQKIKACTQFKWTGCGGNENRFLTEEACMTSCKGVEQEEEIKNPEEVCVLPRRSGTCRSKIERYYFNPKSGKCESFLYTGCEGNANSFTTLVECEEFCTSVMKQNADVNDHPDKSSHEKEVDAEFVQEDCLLAKDAGSCSRFEDRYYFDKLDKECKKFEYGGCGGNNNRFEQEDECSQKCAYYMERKDTDVLPNQNSDSAGGSKLFDESACALPMLMGTCSESHVKYYYSTFEEKCLSFVYSGCGGNGNNFESWSQCWQSCQPEEEDFNLRPRQQHKLFSSHDSDEESATELMKTVDEEEDKSEEDDSFSLLPFIHDSDHRPQHVCSQNYSEGPCAPLDPANFKKRYYFNNATEQCELFFYGGCGGNHNNFVNKSDCETFCKNNASQDFSEKSDGKKANSGMLFVIKHFNKSSCFVSPRHGLCNSNFLRWYFSRWDNICKPYNYTGCGGSDNNFLSKADCEEKCPPIQFNGTEERCDKLRARGHCFMGTTRYFFDKYSQRCVRFTACSDLMENENNFPNKDSCMTACRPDSGDLGDTYALKAEQENPAGSSTSSAVEVVLTFLVIGLVGFAGILAYRFYKSRNEFSPYSMFNNQHSRSGEDNGADNEGSGDPRARSHSSPSAVSFENPVYNSELYNVPRPHP